ncbi:RNA polymerase sigma factor [Flavipsychrobacter stenotrophus]|nr:DUF6596 domain-containing protein [Flavipsychrobacter stenotrophus]
MQQDLIPHLFRTEYSKIVAVLSRLLGLQHLDVAEDIAADTFLAAMEIWPYKGVPTNPEAWVYVVAKNKVRNHLARSAIFMKKVAGGLARDASQIEYPEIDLSEQNISDSQLQMLFAVCHPALSVEAQLGLALKVLCGFGIEEIANALLSNKDTIQKRLYRAKKALREVGLKMELPNASAINERLDSVLTTLYLLFNEGYYSESDDNVLREDLCREAIRLTGLLIENEATRQPEVLALMALMHFHSSRFAARKNERGEMILYDDQDEQLWDREMITKGVYYLHAASQGERLSKYHLEASIAYWHTQKADTKEKWDNILQLFNKLLRLQYSPAAALNRTYALYKVHGRAKAIEEAEKMSLSDNHYYHILLGSLYSGVDNSCALTHLDVAYELAKSAAEKAMILKKCAKLRKWMLRHGFYYMYNKP